MQKTSAVSQKGSCLVILWQKLFAEYEEVGELIYKYICSHHGSVGSGLNAADYVAGVQDVVDLGGKSYPMDFYLSIFSAGDDLTQNGNASFVSTWYCECYKYCRCII